MTVSADSVSGPAIALCGAAALAYAPAMEHTPDEQRDAFLLHEEADLTVDQIALVTDSNRDAAKSRLRYANHKLRAAIKKPEE